MTMTDDTETRAEPSAETRDAELADLRAQLSALDTEVRSLRQAAVVRSEPRVYGEGSEASYFQDLALGSLWGIPGYEAAIERQTRYAMELDAEMRDHRSAEGRRARMVLRELRRAGTREVRDGASSATIVGFTTPQYLVDKWAPYRSPAKAFADQTMLLPLPEVGLQVNLPSFASATSTGAQTELHGVSNSSPAGENLSSTLTTLAGQVDISEQLYDRGGMSGLAFDVITLAQIKSQLDASVDVYVIDEALANAGTVSDATAFSWADFLEDIASGRELLADTAGTRLLATHIFSTTDFFGYATRQVDSEQRPILSPDSSAIVAALAMGDPKWESWTGVHIGQARFHTDDNIPASGANTQIIVARPQETYSFIGDDMAFSYAPTGAQTLTVLVGLRCYVAAITRFPKSVAVLSGDAYPLTLV